MQKAISIECPVELLLNLRLNAETFGEFMKTQTAISLFKEGKISSSIAAQWLHMPRVRFTLFQTSGVCDVHGTDVGILNDL